MSRIVWTAAVLVIGLAMVRAIRHHAPSPAIEKNEAAIALAADAPAAPAAANNWPAFHGGGPLTGVAAALPGGAELKVRWTYDCGEDGRASVEGGAAIVNGVVYVGDTDSSLHAIELATGKRKWAYKSQSGFVTTPLVRFDAQRNDDVIYLGDDGGVFHAVAAKDGTKVWTFETTSTIHASANAADGGRIVFGNDAAEIYCLAATDGKQLWKGAAGDRVNAAPAIAGGVALISGCDAKLRGLAVTDGEERFAFDMGAISGASPAVIDDRLYLGTDQGHVLCLSLDGKTRHWQRDIPESPMVFASAAAAEGIVVVGARDRKVYAFHAADGTPAWEFRTKGDVDSSPVISGGRVYIGSKDKRLYVLDLKTGTKQFEFQAARGIIAPVAAGQGVIVVGDTAGKVYCLEPK